MFVLFQPDLENCKSKGVETCPCLPFFHYQTLLATVAHICHGKTYFSTAKLTFSRQNLLFHGKTYFLTAKHTFPRQNLLSHGKTYFSTAKHIFPRQNLLFHGKTYFSTAKHTFPRQNILFHGTTYFSIPSFQSVSDIEISSLLNRNPLKNSRKSIAISLNLLIYCGH